MISIGELTIGNNELRIKTSENPDNRFDDPIGLRSSERKCDFVQSELPIAFGFGIPDQIDPPPQGSFFLSSCFRLDANQLSFPFDDVLVVPLVRLRLL